MWADLDLVADLAALVEGKLPDNRHQMRLSAYVLAYRLGQVVDAANLRLSTMSDRRYSLVHTGQRGAGETRAASACSSATTGRATAATRPRSRAARPSSRRSRWPSASPT